jgi:hypothetical protein
MEGERQKWRKDEGIGRGHGMMEVEGRRQR